MASSLPVFDLTRSIWRVSSAIRALGYLLKFHGLFNQLVKRSKAERRMKPAFVGGCSLDRSGTLEYVVRMILGALLQAMFHAPGNASVVGCGSVLMKLSAQFDDQLLGVFPQFDSLLDQRTQLFETGIVHESEYEPNGHCRQLNRWN